MFLLARRQQSRPSEQQRAMSFSCVKSPWIFLSHSEQPISNRCSTKPLKRKLELLHQNSVPVTTFILCFTPKHLFSVSFAPQNVVFLAQTVVLGLFRARYKFTFIKDIRPDQA